MRYQYNKRFFKITDENQKIFKKIKVILEMKTKLE